MSENKFKTMRHIETVRNYINSCIKILMMKAEHHDQSKLESPEVEAFEEYTPRLAGLTYGSDEYRECLREMKPALDHHYWANRHHPEFHENGIKDMTLIDLTEMLCDWKAASLRHTDGAIYKSIEINQERFGYSDELKAILINTMQCLDYNCEEIDTTHHKAEES